MLIPLGSNANWQRTSGSGIGSMRQCARQRGDADPRAVPPLNTRSSFPGKVHTFKSANIRLFT